MQLTSRLAITSNLTPEQVRAYASNEDALHIAKQVSAKRCQCCSGEAYEQLACGHYRCELCKRRKHETCIACALAV
jgi:hypothetical protein